MTITRWIICMFLHVDKALAIKEAGRIRDYDQVIVRYVDGCQFDKSWHHEEKLLSHCLSHWLPECALLQESNSVCYRCRLDPALYLQQPKQVQISIFILNTNNKSTNPSKPPFPKFFNIFKFCSRKISLTPI